MTDPLIIKTLSLAFGMLLLSAAWHKASAPLKFRAVLEDYQVLPVFVLPLVAVAVPLFETIIGIAWLSSLATVGVAIATAALLTVYAMAIAINLLRGRVHISCGCGFGRSDEDEPLSWWLVARNAALVGAALIAMTPPSARELGALDWLTILAALATSTLLYLGGSQLLRNGSAIRSWRRPRD